MRIKEQKELYFLLKKLGIDNSRSILYSYLHDDESEFYLEDELSLLYLSFSGYLNSGNFTDDEAAISGFIMMNLNKGKKLFEKKKNTLPDNFTYTGKRFEEPTDEEVEECRKSIRDYLNKKK